MKLIKSNKPSLIVGAGFRIVPGINQMDDKVWERAKETRIIKQLLKEKMILDQTPKELKQATPEELKVAAKRPEGDDIDIDEPEERPRQPNALKAVGQNKAIELVKETLDPLLLADWEAQEDRVKVKAAIKSQQTKIAAETKKPKKKDDETEGEDEFSDDATDEGEES